MTAMPELEQQLQLEVRELTDLLRADGSFADLRDAFAGKGLSASETVLVGLIEGEDESRYGVLVTVDQECVRFETAPNGQLTRWEIVEDPDALTADFQAASVGIAMKARGEIA